MRVSGFGTRSGEFHHARFHDHPPRAPAHAELGTPAVRPLQARRDLRPAAPRIEPSACAPRRRRPTNQKGFRAAARGPCARHSLVDAIDEELRVVGAYPPESYVKLAFASGARLKTASRAISRQINTVTTRHRQQFSTPIMRLYRVKI